MHLSDEKGIELVFYYLRDIASLWYDQYEEAHSEDTTPTKWVKFMDNFIAHLFPLELWEHKVSKFVSLK